METKDKLSLLRIFSKIYPNPRSELNFKNEYELIVCVMLSAQCTDKKVNEVAPLLFKKYRDFATLSQASLPKIENIIRPINYYKTKSKNLISMAQKVIVEFEGRLPKTHTSLMTLAGVGQKTANVVLCEQGQIPTFPVDTHVFRVSRRLGLAKGNTPQKVEEELRQEFKPKYWRNLHHWLIFHGRRVCKAPRPRCDECRVRGICEWGKANKNSWEKHGTN